MSRLESDIAVLEYGGLPQFGPEHLLARLAARDRVPPGFPLLGKEAQPEPSDSAFMNLDSLKTILKASNPAALPAGPCRFVVAGQQAGLLTGPLYTILKAATCIRLAVDLEKKTGVRHVPLFWTASEDHDLLEVNRCFINGRRFVARDRDDAVPARRPQVADVSVEAFRPGLLAFLEEVLPSDQSNKSRVLDMVSGASFENYAALFRDLMRKLFQDRNLHLVDPLALRPLTAPVLAALVEKWPTVTAAFDEGTARLRSHGLEPPLREPGLFEIVDHNRIKVPIDSETATLSTGACSLAEAADRIRSDPAAFSPNAALRPVLQDAIIPVSAFVCGPAELLYAWQIDSIYTVAEVRRSFLRPRISATFIEPKTRRAAARLGLASAGLFTARQLLDRDAQTGGADAETNGRNDSDAAAIREAGQRILKTLDGLLAAKNDKSLQRSRNTLSMQVDKISARIKALKEDEAGRGRRNLEKLAAGVLPESRLQERTANVFEFISRYGPDFLRLIAERLDPWRIAHHLVEIKTGRGPDHAAIDKGGES